jgi:hypothetical protein
VRYRQDLTAITTAITDDGWLLAGVGVLALLVGAWATLRAARRGEKERRRDAADAREQALRDQAAADRKAVADKRRQALSDYENCLGKLTGTFNAIAQRRDEREQAWRHYQDLQGYGHGPVPGAFGDRSAVAHVERQIRAITRGALDVADDVFAENATEDQCAHAARQVGEINSGGIDGGRWQVLVPEANAAIDTPEKEVSIEDSSASSADFRERLEALARQYGYDA